MYASLDKIDLVTGGRDGGPIGIVLTDHRRTDENEAEPEVSVLLALARAIASRRAMEARGSVVAEIVYRAQHEVPAFLADALAAVGAITKEGG